jgi:succinate-semialdehyde dehydrogenase/glutarate-semialdehyde dehydrogenase
MTTVFRSINPKNNRLFRTFEAISYKELDIKIEASYNRFRAKYSKGLEDLPRRFQKLGYVKQNLRENKENYASLITQEMGKPITQAELEIEKCISHIDYYIANATRFMQPEHLEVQPSN